MLFFAIGILFFMLVGVLTYLSEWSYSRWWLNSLRAAGPQALVALSMLSTAAFAFYFVVSSCAWLGSSCFIVGPKKQFQNMKQPKRRNSASTSRFSSCSLFATLCSEGWV